MTWQFGSFFRKPRIFVPAFFLLYLSLGLSIYKDYGISFDEPTQRQHALVSAKYLADILFPDFHSPEFSGLPPLAEYSEKEYGVIFDLPLYVAEVIMGYQPGVPLKSFYLRHLCTFLLFFVSVFFFFLIGRDRFNSWAMGLTGCLFLILSPRIFAESFYNNKDIVFLSFFIITIYFFIRFLNNKTFANSFLFALASAVTVDQRITGVFIPFLAIIMSGIDARKAATSFKGMFKRLLPLFKYLLCFAILVILFWPYLWADPLRNFINAFVHMSKFPWHFLTLYTGKFIKPEEVPWHYIPVWLLITTPIIYTVLFLLGFFRSVGEIMRNGLSLYSEDRGRQDLLFLLLFLVPVAAVIILRSALYDGWRQMYFIYAPFLLIALKGLAHMLGLLRQANAGIRSRIAASVAVGFVVLSLVFTSYQMIRFHPFQNVYFNLLAGKDIGQNFERDYWGLSYRGGLEYIVKTDKRPIIKVAGNFNLPVISNANFLGKEDSRRLIFIDADDAEQADYFLTEYRGHPEQYENTSEVYCIYVDDLKIMSVLKLR